MALIPAVTLAVQGIFVLVTGVYALVRPAEFIAQMGDFAALGNEQIVHSLSLQLLTMGVYFLLAARAPKIHSTALTINMFLRGLAGYLFWQDGARAVAGWEFLWIVLNGAAILFG